MNALSSEIKEWLQEVCNSSLGIREIWFIGSRANGTNRIDSDWDFLVIGDAGFIETIRQQKTLHRIDVDFLASEDGMHFHSAWGRQKTMVLSKIKWKKTSPYTAIYEGTKWVGDEDTADDDSPPCNISTLGDFKCISCFGYKITTI